MQKLRILFAMFGGALGVFIALSALPTAVYAGSCYEPVNERNQTGKIVSGVNLRDKTCMDSSVVASLSTGAIVHIVGEADGWYLIKLDNGTKGYVWNTFVQVTSDSYDKSYETTKVTEEKTAYEKTSYEKTSSELNIRLKGYILLQVESHGEAWYVHPDSGKRYYMKDGDTAYEMMRAFGLGASNTDIDALLNGDKALAARLAGKIVLAVQRHGEAYYIHPKNLTVHYLQNGEEAYRVMREQSLGITNKDLDAITSKSFEPIADKQSDSSDSSADFTAGSITLSAKEVDGYVYLTWSVNGANTSQGFKVVKSTEMNPSYPDDSPVYLSDANTREYKKTGLTAGKTYHFRVCNYTGNGCGVYSNDVSVTIGDSTDSMNSTDASFFDGQISLSGEQVGEKLLFDWSILGVNTSQGFKFIMSTEANPVYPGNDATYLSDSGARSHYVKNLTPGKTYYFRVCNYTGEGCGVYSNQITITVDGQTDSTVNSSIPAGVDLDALSYYWLLKVNELRANAGLRQLVLDDRWEATATEWAVYMGENGLMTHDRPDGKSMHQWIDTKGLDFTERYSQDGWNSNYFTENIAWGYASEATDAQVKKILDDTMAFFLSEASYNGSHYRTIYHEDWNSVGLGFHFAPNGNGSYKVSIAMHYGSLVL